MKRLDDEQTEASRPRGEEGVPADVAVTYLRNLAETWRHADRGSGRRMLAEALFERVDALGFREATLHLTDTAVAHGFAAVIPETDAGNCWEWSGREGSRRHLRRSGHPLRNA